MRLHIIIIFLAIFGSSTLASKGDRYVEKKPLPDSRVAVIAEGDMEPRSIGSYSIRLYGAGNPKTPTDDFQGGIIRARDGIILKTVLVDIDVDGIPELVVVIQCVGTGGYLSADAFNFEKTKPVLKTSVTGLDKNADVLKALRETAKTSLL